MTIFGASASHLAFYAGWEGGTPCGTLEGVTFCGDGELDIRTSNDFATHQLVYCDDPSIFEEAVVNFWDGDKRINTVAIGDEFSYRGMNYQVVINYDGLELKV
ncbi:MAG: hypothetical protein AB7F40_06100 [Victivallaceae bacterium]